MPHAHTLIAFAFAACHFEPAVVGSVNADAPPDESTDNACMQACAWGCIATPSPHCGALVPAGGVATGADLGGAADATIGSSIDTGDGNNMKPKIDGAIWGDYRQVNNFTIFRVKNVHVAGRVGVTGKLGLVIVASGDVVVDGVVDATTCDNGSQVGGHSGGSPAQDGMGSGAGQGSDGQDFDSGGGGGNGGTGGNGIDGQQGGAAYGAGDLAIAHLSGGGGGGGGVGAGGPTGGNGGAAIQIVSNTMIVINAGAGINGGGCGAKGSMDKSGGGGGAGGTILLEAPHVTIASGAAIAVNGGGGGGAIGAVQVRNGANGSLDRNAAPGGVGTPSGSSGAAGAVLDGTNGTMIAFSGGAGGGIGRIRINTTSGVASVAGMLSPALTDQPTTCTQGPAAVQ